MDRVYVKAKIRKIRTSEKTTFEYPELWNSEKIHVVAYEDNPDSMGSVEEYCIGVMAPEYWEVMKDDPDMQRISPGEANVDGKKWKPKQTKVIDPDAVILALATVTSKRTERQKNALNPLHEEPGINEGQDFDIRKFVAPGQVQENLTEAELTEE